MAREGSALLRVRGGGSINVGDGDVTITRISGSDGTVILSVGSLINAGWVGVGAQKTDAGNVDGGTGTFVLVNSTLTASEIVVGKTASWAAAAPSPAMSPTAASFHPAIHPARWRSPAAFWPKLAAG